MGFVSSLVRDLKFAFRQMRQTPIVSGVALLSLALGIGANVAIFSLVVGAAASVGAGRFINTLLYNLAASDRTMIVTTAMTLALAAAIAGYLPARRAARIDPMAALREE